MAFLYPPIDYYYQIVYQAEVPGSQWQMTFCACKNLVGYKDHIRDSFKNGIQGVSNTFQFQEPDEPMELDIGECRIEGWSIISQSAAKISKETIDKWKYSRGSFPNIIFTITSSEGAKENLEHKVLLKGIKSDSDYFNIIVNTQREDAFKYRQDNQEQENAPFHELVLSGYGLRATFSGINSKVAFDVLATKDAFIKESFTDMTYLADKMVERNIIRDDRKRKIVNGAPWLRSEQMQELLNDLKDAVKLDGKIFTCNNSSSICSNPPVLIISLDGFRADYLYRGITPTIKSFASDGVQSEYMTPAFPSLTFPNHFTIVTGLHPESHGIISNAFFSREFNESFYIGSKTSNDPKWWLGEPIWVTAVKGTLKTAVYFWPGSEVPIEGIFPTTYFNYDSSVPFTERMETVLSWIEQPDATRPQFMAAYISEPDHTAHQYGPNSTEVDDALKQVDSSVSVLINGLKDKNLYNCVNIIIVSDHGMATIDDSKVVVLVPQILPEEYTDDVQHSIYGELAMLYVTDSDPDLVNEIYHVMKENATRLKSPIDIYLRNEIPKDFFAGQFNKNRYGDIIIIAHVSGYIKIRDDFPSSFNLKGAHGYDNKNPLMRALFLAHGPSFKPNYKSGPVNNIDIYELMCHLLHLPPSPNNGTLANISNILK
uniref:Extracellular Endonuclease subunit A domain-containing protein n=1 Tax=Amphimedon queenslandica TaxID=400682 RepID=A0A1X7UNL6_AMPQE